MSLVWQSRAIAAAVAAGVVFYVVFAIAGEPWGTLNDISGAALAALGALMSAGVIVLPGVLLRYDDAGNVPGWIYAGFIGWLGILLFPVWALRATGGQARGAGTAQLTAGRV